MSGLDLLGADDALATQYITLRVTHIDREKLKNKVGGSTGQIASSALTFVDLAPKAALDTAVPMIKKVAKDYGIDLEVAVTNAPPSKTGKRALSEFWPGIMLGTVIGGSSLLIVKLVQRLVGR